MTYQILLSGESAYEANDLEYSDWGDCRLFRQELIDWLDSRLQPHQWDHDMAANGRDCVVWIDDRQVAVLFKLVWG